MKNIILLFLTCAAVLGQVRPLYYDDTTRDSGPANIDYLMRALNISGLTASTPVELDAGKNLVSGTQTGTGAFVRQASPTLTTPTIASFISATHTHADPAGGGVLTPSAVGLSDPGADRILFWDDSAGLFAWLTAGSGLTITTTTMTAAGGSGAPSGTVVNTGTPAQYNIPYYLDATGTNIGPSQLSTDATGTNFYAGGFLINTLTVTNPIPVTSGGIGIASGTSGGIPYFSGATTIASSAALAANDLVIGGGAGAAPSTITTAAGIVTFIGTPSSANLATALTDESGSNAALFAQNHQRNLTINPGAADDTYAGQTFTGLNNSGGVTQWDVVYLNGSSQWVLADANGSGTFPARGLATATVATATATAVLEDGVVRNDAWTWTPGGTIYLSTTAGALTQTPPATTGDKVQVIGYAIDADTMRVKISADYGTAP